MSKLTYPTLAPTLLESAAHNQCQCHALVMGNWTENPIEYW